MISFAFILCSTLLLSGVSFAEEETSIDIAKEAEVAPQDPIHVEVGKQAAAASIKVLNDMLDGKDYKTALLDRGIEALGKIRGAAASMGHSFLKRVKELKDGVPLEKVAGNIWKAINRKFTGKNKKYTEIVEAAGADNVQSFIEKVTQIIKEAIMEALESRKKEKAAIEDGKQ